MAIPFHPQIGTIVICDFTSFVEPEMTKRRPVIVVSPRFREREDLCTVVPLSTTPPNVVMPYHYKIIIDPILPSPYNAPFHWVKADMLYTISLTRLYLPFLRKDDQGKRLYDIRIIENNELLRIQKCILHGIGLMALTNHL